ncbi:peptidylprolyl isomerase, partial [Mesorhizobium sp. M7A.F.Ca.CA.004.04.2.1]
MQLKKLASFLVVLAGLVAVSVSAFAADPENTMIITLK